MKKTIATLLWITGLCLAGSEGAIWVNLIGLLVFLLSSFLLIDSFDEQPHVPHCRKVNQVRNGRLIREYTLR